MNGRAGEHEHAQSSLVRPCCRSLRGGTLVGAVSAWGASGRRKSASADTIPPSSSSMPPNPAHRQIGRQNPRPRSSEREPDSPTVKRSGCRRSCICSRQTSSERGGHSDVTTLKLRRRRSTGRRNPDAKSGLLRNGERTPGRRWISRTPFGIDKDGEVADVFLARRAIGSTRWDESRSCVGGGERGHAEN